MRTWRRNSRGGMFTRTAVFFTHFHPDHTGGVPALSPRHRVCFRQGRSQLFGASCCRQPLLRQVEVFRHRFFDGACDAASRAECGSLGDGSFWAISVPGHTDDDMAYLINGATPVLLTGDASHFAWAFTKGVAPRGWNQGRNRPRLRQPGTTAGLRKSLSERKADLRTRNNCCEPNVTRDFCILVHRKGVRPSLADPASD